jgi:hypothetical protein
MCSEQKSPQRILNLSAVENKNKNEYKEVALGV